MAAGPDGPEVGRVTVRVAPDSSKFGDDAKKGIEKETKNLEAVIPIKGEADQEQIRREVEKIRVPKLVIPMTVDRKQAREEIDKILAKPMRLKSIVVPVRIDRAQLRKAVNDAAASVDLAAVTIRADADSASARAAGREVAQSAQDAVNSDAVNVDNVHVNEASIRDQVDSALDSIREIDTKVRADLDDSNWPDWARKGAEHFEFNVNLDWERVPDEIQTILREFDRGTRTLKLEVDTDDIKRAETKLADDVEHMTETLTETLTDSASKVGSDVGEAVASAIDENLDAVRKVEVEVDVDASNLERNVEASTEKVQRTLRDSPLMAELDANERVLLLKIGKVEQALKKLRSDSTTITPDVELQIAEAEARLARFNRQLSEVGRRRTKIQIDLEADTKKLEKTVGKVKPKVSVDPDIDTAGLNNRLRKANSSIVRIIGELFKGVGGAATGLFQDLPEAMQSGFGSASSSLTNLSKGINQLGKDGGNAGQLIRQGLLQAAQAAIALGAIFLRLGAIGGLVAVAGAGITGAVSAAAVAIAALPAGLGLVATAAGVVALGMDGIKKAAETLKPTFDKLKASASEVFERGLTPIFKNLKPLIESLEQPIDNVAQSLVNVAGDLQRVLTDPGPNADRIRDIFKQTAETINGMRPGLRDVVDTFIRLTDQPAAFQAFESAFNRFGAAFKENVAGVVEDGSLESSFRSLGAVIGEIGEGVAALFANLTRMFGGGAGAGMAVFLNDLSNFFGRFDWERLGAAVGDVFTGLGETLRGVDDQTIEDITVAFEDLGALFRDADFQSDIQTIIGAIDEVIAAIRFLADAAADIGSVIASVIEAIGGENVATAAVVLGIGLFLAKITSTLTGWWKGLKTIVGAFKIADLFKKNKLNPKDVLGKDKINIGDLFDDKSRKNIPKINPLDLIGRTLKWTDILPDLVGTGIGLLGDVIRDLFLDPDLDIDLDGLRDAIQTAIKDGFSEALSDAKIDVKLTLGDEAITSLVDSIAEGILAQQQKITDAFSEAFANASTAAGEGLTGIDEQINTAADQWVATIDAAFADRVTPAFDEGWAGLAEGVPAAMEPVNTALGEQLTLLAETVRAGFADQVRPAWDEGFVGLSDATTLGMTALATAITTAFTEQIVLAVTTGMEQARVAYETGFTGMQEATAAQFILLNEAWLAGFTGLNTVVTEQLTLLVEAVRLGLAQLPTIAAEQLALFVLAFTDSVATLSTSFTTPIAEMVTAVETELIRMATVAAEQLDLMLTLFGTAGTAIASSFAPLFTTMVDLVCAEMVRLVECVRLAVEQITALLGGGGGGGAGGGGGGGLADVFTFLGEWILFILEGILLAIETFVGTIGVSIGAIITAFINGLDQASEYFNQWSEGMEQRWQEFWDRMPTIADAGMTTTNASFTTGFDTMTATSETGMTAITTAVENGMTAMVNSVQRGVNQAVAELDAAVGQFEAAGRNMGAALARGLDSQVGAVRAAAGRLADAASAGVSAAARMASPSKVFIALGKLMAIGLAIGMERSEDQVTQAARSLAEEAERYARMVAGAMQGITGDVNIQPNIPNWDSQMQSGIIDSPLVQAANGPLIGQLTVQTPEGVSAKQMMDEVVFAMRKARRGGLYAR